MVLGIYPDLDDEQLYRHTRLVTASWIWKSKTLPKSKTFLWRCAHDSIGVKACLARRRVVDEELCPICRGESESVLHALRDCAWVKAVWVQLGVETTNQAFWMTDLQEWLNINGKVNNSYLTAKPPWKMIYPFAVWKIWKSRNSFVFNRKNQSEVGCRHYQPNYGVHVLCVLTQRSTSIYYQGSAMGEASGRLEQIELRWNSHGQHGASRMWGYCEG